MQGEEALPGKFLIINKSKTNKEVHLKI